MKTKMLFRFLMFAYFTCCFSIKADCQLFDDSGIALSGRNTTSAQSGVDALFANPGGLADINKTSLVMQYVQQFSIPDLWNGEVACIFKTRNGALPFSVVVEGPSYSINTRIKSGYSINLSNRISIGMLAYVDLLMVSDLDDDLSSGFTLGVLYSATNKLSLGFMLNAPSIFRKTRQVDYSKLVLRTAFSYKIYDSASLDLEICKEICNPIEIIASIHFNLSKQVVMYTCYHSAVDELSLGFSTHLGKMMFLVSAGYNLQLGVTPEILIVR